MKIKFVFQTIGIFVMMLSLVGCTTPTLSTVPTITLTIVEDKCWISNLEATPYGEFKIDLVMNEKIPTESGYALVALEAGKTFEDLLAWTSADQPSWVVVVHGVHEFTIGTHTYSYNPSKIKGNAAYHGGSLYLVCMRTNPGTGKTENLGSFGPIEQKKLSGYPQADQGWSVVRAICWIYCMLFWSLEVILSC